MTTQSSTQLAITFPHSRVLQFKTQYSPESGLRVGQAFYNFCDLHKLTDEHTRALADRLYEADGPEAWGLIEQHTDWQN